MAHHLRIARPVSDLAHTTDMYRRGLGLQVVGSFGDHDGFDGAMLGSSGGPAITSSSRTAAAIP